MKTIVENYERLLGLRNGQSWSSDHGSPHKGSIAFKSKLEISKIEPCSAPPARSKRTTLKQAMSAGTLKTLAVLAVFLTVDLCWMRGTTQQGKYTDRLVPMNACPHNVSAVQIKEPIWKKRATAREKKVQPEKPYAMLNCMNNDHFGNEDYDQSPRTTIRPQASHQPRKGAITRPFKGQPTPSMTCKTEMPSIHETEMIIIHKTNKGLSPEQISLPLPTFPPRRMSSQQDTTVAAEDPDAPMDPPDWILYHARIAT